MNSEFIEALRMLEKERGLDMEVLLTAIEESLVSAYKREFDIKTEKRDQESDEAIEDITASIDRETGEMRVYQPVTVVETVTKKHCQISLEDARAISDELEIGDQLVSEVDPAHFGRLAAQTAKSVINQRLAQAEKERIQQEFSDRVGSIAAGVVQRKDRREVTVDIGRAEAVLPSSEQSGLDGYRFNQRMKFYIVKVDERKNRPIVIVSRSHPDLVRRLFESEVPEISSGTVEIVNIAREAGSRTKIAVTSTDLNVDSVGSCVGQRGLRVQAVIDELNGEKIDIIEWDADPIIYISNALSPAKVVRVDIEEDEFGQEKKARVVVPDHQLSLAIGRAGQNARLAAHLTGWKIDIKSESQYHEMLENELFSRFNEALNSTAEDDSVEVLEESSSPEEDLLTETAGLEQDETVVPESAGAEIEEGASEDND